LLALILIAVAGVAIYRFLHRSPLERGVNAVVKAYAKRRLIEPRLSGGFLAAEYLPGSDGNSIDAEQLEYAIDLIAGSGSGVETPPALLAKGVLLLAQGKTSDAIKSLRTAAKAEPNNSEAHNNLGACLYEMGNLDGALFEFQAALAGKPPMPEARFNRALCYQRLGLRESASTAFDEVIQTERNSGWLGEARRRLEQVSREAQPVRSDSEEALSEVNKDLTAALAAGDQQTARKIINERTRTVIQQCARWYSGYIKAAAESDSASALKDMAELEQTGLAFLEARGDSFIAACTAYLKSLPQSEVLTEKRLDEDLRDATRRSVSDSSAAMRQRFEHLAAEFARRGNYVSEYKANYRHAVCLYSSNHPGESLRELEPILRNTQARHWHYYSEMTLSQMGSTYSELGEDSLAIKYCSRDVEPSHNTPYFEAKTSQTVGLCYWHLGDLDRALDSLMKSTKIFEEKEPVSEELANNYVNIADIFRLRGSHELARLFSDVAVTFAKKARHPDLLAQSLSFSAVEMGLSNESKAAEDLQGAFEALNEIDAEGRRFAEPLVDIRTGAINLLQEKPQEAIDHYVMAEAILDEPESDVTLRIEAYRGMAKALARLGRFDEARSKLERAMEVIDQQRGRIAESKNRSHYLEATRGVFDEMIVLTSGAMANFVEAFNTCERSRARTLLDEVSLRNELAAPQASADLTLTKAGRTVGLEDLHKALPPGLIVLEYAVTDDLVKIFVVTKSGLEVKSSSITSAKLRRLVSDYVELIQDQAPLNDVSRRATELYNLLVKPIEGLIEGKATLCIVPDDALNFLPFAALLDDQGKYLIETHPLIYAPSASILTECLKEAQKKTQAPQMAVVVGNPSFDTRDFPRLRPLPEAVKEAREIAKLYPNNRLLIERDATEGELRAALAKSDLAHLAVHAVVDEASPGEVRLALAKPESHSDLAAPSISGGLSKPPSADDGVLFLNEVYGLRLPNTRLVVLSACESGVGQYYRGEGLVSLVYPFIVATVPTVVASLWSVQSEATSELMYQFHSARVVDKAMVGEALRAAQLKLASGAYKHPFYWAAFMAVGCDQ
jgi:CHAT domain-containing protein/Flp pilus assembly protein TadD